MKTVKINDKTHQKLKTLSNSTGITMSKIIERIVINSTPMDILNTIVDSYKVTEGEPFL